MGGFLSRSDKRIRDWMDSDDERPACSPRRAPEARQQPRAPGAGLGRRRVGRAQADAGGPLHRLRAERR